MAILPISIPGQSPRLAGYFAWVSAWIEATNTFDASDDAALSIAPSELVSRFRDNNLHQCSKSEMLEAVRTARSIIAKGHVHFSEKIKSSHTHEVTNPLPERYDPRVECDCKGLIPASDSQSLSMALQGCNCHAIQKMVSEMEAILERQYEWQRHGFFDGDGLREAVTELVMSNADIQPWVSTCHGASLRLSEVKAPDRRPNTECDSDPEVYQTLYPTFEKVKILADAKNFMALAGGVSIGDEGLTRAVGDMINDMLIADYCEAADDGILRLLQNVGSAAVAFVRLCNLAGVVADWHYNAIVTNNIHFRALGYYRNHAISRLPTGFYGSRMTHRLAHRKLDVGSLPLAVIVSLAIGEDMTEDEFDRVSSACQLVNDLADLRSDTMRNARENPLVRGVRGNACRYINTLLVQCLGQVCDMILTKKLLGIMVMVCCQWSVMGSHHKLYELYHGLDQVPGLPPCQYDELDERYQSLLQALKPYGTLGENGPSPGMKRKHLDLLYYSHRQSHERHLAWLADMTRLLLNPRYIRRLTDVVHYQWNGSLGQSEYCP